MNRLIPITPFETAAYINETDTARVRVVGVTHDSGQPKFVAMRSDGGNTWLRVL